MAQDSTYYESDAGLAEYAEFHYGDHCYGVENFPARLAEIALSYAQGPRRRALDLGCASGRATFELARVYEHVDGVDFSEAFIEQCQRMARDGQLRYGRLEEGVVRSDQCRRLEDLGLSEAAQRTQFAQGDACDLDPALRDYDLVLAANLVDRLPKPTAFLDAMAERIVSGGVLLIATPGTWMASYTTAENWLGGYEKDGQPVTTLDGLTQHLSANFEPIGPARDVAFVLRETARKHQHTLSQVSCWRRR
jgi:putative 4-mercaptohistidine N1-methyltranferase